jgi:hypothetical protein
MCAAPFVETCLPVFSRGTSGNIDAGPHVPRASSARAFFCF